MGDTYKSLCGDAMPFLKIKSIRQAVIVFIIIKLKQRNTESNMCIKQDKISKFYSNKNNGVTHLISNKNLGDKRNMFEDVIELV